MKFVQLIYDHPKEFCNLFFAIVIMMNQCHNIDSVELYFLLAAPRKKLGQTQISEWPRRILD